MKFSDMSQTYAKTKAGSPEFAMYPDLRFFNKVDLKINKLQIVGL